MCHLCPELDAKLERYRKLAQMIADEGVVESLSSLIAETEETKRKLHPEPDPGN